jgi:hypothetical protein
MVPQDRIELSTYPLPRGCATTTLLRHVPVHSRGTAAITHATHARKGVALPAMPAKKDSAKTARLAAALKENLKRRKAKARATGAAKSSPARALGTAPQAGLESAPEPHPNAAKKRS